MKSIQLFLVAGVIFLASCQKENDQLAIPEQATASAQAGTAKISSWRGVNFAQTQTETTGSLFSSEIIDPSIDSSVLSDGLVLVYSKENSSVTTMPFAQPSGIEWSYEVRQGAISIAANASKTTALANGLQFAYVVVPAAKIAELENKGTSVDNLMNLDFTAAEKLFH